MTDFCTLLDSIARRPGMYVGSCSLWAVATYLDGYCLALNHLGKQSPLSGWMRWVELRLGILHSAWHWTRILLHVYGCDELAIKALPALFREFETERGRIGIEAIFAKHEREFAGPLGISQSRVPKSTDTHDPYL